MRPLLIASLLLLAACGSSGTELRDPPPGATSPRPTSSTTQAPTSLVGVFSLSSQAFTPGGELPARHTCNGEDLSPALSWSAVPEGTVELALVVSTPTEDGMDVHWVLPGIDPTSVGTAEGALPLGGREGPNTEGGTGWAGPCPGPGESLQVNLTLYALTEPPAVTDAMGPIEIVGALDSAPGSRAVLTATATGIPATTESAPSTAD